MDGFKQSADYDYMKDINGVNMDDENNRHASCINTSPEGVAGAYSCSRGPLMAGAGYLTLGAAAALSVAAMVWRTFKTTISYNNSLIALIRFEDFL